MGELCKNLTIEATDYVTETRCSRSLGSTTEETYSPAIRELLNVIKLPTVPALPLGPDLLGLGWGHGDDLACTARPVC